MRAVEVVFQENRASPKQLLSWVKDHKTLYLFLQPRSYDTLLPYLKQLEKKEI
ncbi:MAG: hypothetical protein GXN92_03475, partial [Candidatus Micrarchaeota archaeon]|nr:hypothetical protein [Candidatus Micrarchaeota archaeon]